MKGYSPTLFEKLLRGTQSAHGSASVRRLSVEQLKNTVAEDLEALFNTRLSIPESRLSSYEECQKSLISYGLTDFSGLSLNSSDDQALICQSLERSILRHEPRLKEVKITLEIGPKNSNHRLRFAISALLMVSESQEPVSFDAVLQTATLQYSIQRAVHIKK
jgi:type VI secretion system protein ImpF